MEAAQLGTQPSPGSDAWMAVLPTSTQTSSLFQKVMAQSSAQKEAAEVAKKVRRAIQRPKAVNCETSLLIRQFEI
jgi:hypothetical protein